jgi:hypothetical protein
VVWIDGVGLWKRKFKIVVNGPRRYWRNGG